MKKRYLVLCFVAIFSAQASAAINYALFIEKEKAFPVFNEIPEANSRTFNELIGYIQSESSSKVKTGLLLPKDFGSNKTVAEINLLERIPYGKDDNNETLFVDGGIKIDIYQKDNTILASIMSSVLQSVEEGVPSVLMEQKTLTFLYKENRVYVIYFNDMSNLFIFQTER